MTSEITGKRIVYDQIFSIYWFIVLEDNTVVLFTSEGIFNYDIQNKKINKLSDPIKKIIFDIYVNKEGVIYIRAEDLILFSKDNGKSYNENFGSLGDPLLGLDANFYPDPHNKDLLYSINHNRIRGNPHIILIDTKKNIVNKSIVIKNEEGDHIGSFFPDPYEIGNSYFLIISQNHYVKLYLLQNMAIHVKKYFQ